MAQDTLDLLEESYGRFLAPEEIDLGSIPPLEQIPVVSSEIPSADPSSLAIPPGSITPALSPDDFSVGSVPRGTTTATAQPVGAIRQFGRDLLRGIDILQQTGYGAGALAASAVGADKVAQWALEGYEINKKEIEANPGAIGSYKNIHGFGDLGQYAVEKIAENIAMFLPSLATGGIGAFVGGAAARKGAEKLAAGMVNSMVERGVARATAEAAVAKLTQATVAKRVAAGQFLGSLAGAYPTSVALEGGQIYPDILEKTGQSRPGLALGFAALAGALDVVEPIYALRRLMGPVGKPAVDMLTKGLVKRLGTEGAKQFAIESTTEGLQSLIENAAVKAADPSRPYWTQETIDDAIDSFLAGGFAGGGVGVAVEGARAGAQAAENVRRARERSEDRRERLRREYGGEVAGKPAPGVRRALAIPESVNEQIRHSLDDMRAIAEGKGLVRLYHGTRLSVAREIEAGRIELPQNWHDAARYVASLYGIPWVEFQEKVISGRGWAYGDSTRLLSTAPAMVAANWGDANVFPYGEIMSALNADARIYIESKRTGISQDELLQSAFDKGATYERSADALGLPNKMPKADRGAIVEIIVDARAIPKGIRDIARAELRSDLSDEDKVEVWNGTYKDIKIPPQAIRSARVVYAAPELEGAGVERRLSLEPTRTPTPAAIPSEIDGFATLQGSTYKLVGDGTQRTKTPHEQHDVTDVGLKTPSVKTVYISPDFARELGMWQTASGRNKRVWLTDDGKVVLLSENPRTGRLGRDPLVYDSSFSTIPEIGKSPLELFEKVEAGLFKGTHPGNPIVRLDKSPAKAPAIVSPRAAPTIEDLFPPDNPQRYTTSIMVDTPSRPGPHIVIGRQGEIHAMMTGNLTDEEIQQLTDADAGIYDRQEKRYIKSTDPDFEAARQGMAEKMQIEQQLTRGDSLAAHREAKEVLDNLQPSRDYIPPSVNDSRFKPGASFQADELQVIQDQYSREALKQGIEPTDLVYHIGSGNAVVFRAYNSADYVVGQFIGDVFAVSHYAPNYQRTGLQALLDLLNTHTPVVFAVPDRLARPLERLGFKRSRLIVPMTFRGKEQHKNILINNAVAERHLQDLAKWWMAERLISGKPVDAQILPQLETLTAPITQEKGSDIEQKTSEPAPPQPRRLAAQSLAEPGTTPQAPAVEPLASSSRRIADSMRGSTQVKIVTDPDLRLWKWAGTQSPGYDQITAAINRLIALGQERDTRQAAARIKSAAERAKTMRLLTAIRDELRLGWSFETAFDSFGNPAVAEALDGRAEDYGLAKGATDVDRSGNYEVTINLAAIQDELTLRQTLAHELWVHVGIEGDPQLASILDGVGRNVPDNELQETANRYGFDLAKPEQRRVALIEYAAARAEQMDAAGQGPSTLWQRIWQAIRDFIDRLTGWAATEADIREIIRMGKERVESQEPGTQPSRPRRLVLVGRSAVTSDEARKNLYRAIDALQVAGFTVSETTGTVALGGRELVRRATNRLLELVPQPERKSAADQFPDRPNAADIGMMIGYINADTQVRHAPMSVRWAEKMERAGSTWREIRDETGWERDWFNEWKFYVRPHAAFIRPSDKKIPKLEEVLDYPQLYVAYPQLRNVKVVDKSDEPGNEEGSAYWDPFELEIVFLEQPTKSHYLHEIQHAIQQIERWPFGAAEHDVIQESDWNRLWRDFRASMAKYKGASIAGNHADAIASLDEANAILQQLKETDIAHQDMVRGWSSYMKAAGEAEARLVERLGRWSDSARSRHSLPQHMENMLVFEGLMTPGESVSDVLEKLEPSGKAFSERRLSLGKRHHQVFGPPVGVPKESVEHIEEVIQDLKDAGYNADIAPTTENKWAMWQAAMDMVAQGEAMSNLRAVVPAQMAPGLWWTELWGFALRLGAEGDPSMLQLMAYFHHLAPIAPDGTTEAAARGLRALQEGANRPLWKISIELNKALKQLIGQNLGAGEDLLTEIINQIPGAASVIDQQSLAQDLESIAETLPEVPPVVDAETQMNRNESTARRIAERLADLYGGAEWIGNKKQQNAVVKVLTEFYKTSPIPADLDTGVVRPTEQGGLPAPLSRQALINDLVSKLTALDPPVTEETAKRLAEQAVTKLATDWQNARARALQRAGESKQIRVSQLISEILTQPMLAQSDKQWLHDTARKWFLAQGLPSDQAEAAAKLFQDRFRESLAKAAKNLADKIIKRGQIKNTEHLHNAIRAAMFDPSRSWFQRFAESAGIAIPSDDQIKELARLDLKLADPTLTAPDTAEITERMLAIYLKLKLPPGLVETIASSFVATNLTGLRTGTVNLFAPFVEITWERMLATIANPTQFANIWKTWASAWTDFWQTYKFGMTTNAFTFVHDEYGPAASELKRLWITGLEDLKNNNTVRRGKGLLKLLYGSQQFLMRNLNAIDQSNMIAKRKANLALYGMEAFRIAGLGPRHINALVEAMSSMREAAYNEAIGVLHITGKKVTAEEKSRASIHADYVAFRMAEYFIGKTIGGESGMELARKAAEAAELDAYNVTGRLSPLTPQGDEGGLLWEPLNALIQTSSRWRTEGGWRSMLAVAIFGYISVPLRTARFYAWHSPIGLMRIGMAKLRRAKGWENVWKQSLANELQERLRLKTALAATAVQGVLLGGAGLAFLGLTADDSDDERKKRDGIRVYVTGNGPKQRELRDSWRKSGFRENSLVFFMGGKATVLPLNRVGEVLAHVFWPLSAIDDYHWRKKETEAKGKPFEERLDETIGSGVMSYASLLGQRGLGLTLSNVARVVTGEGGVERAIAALGSSSLASATMPFLGLQRSVLSMIEGPTDRSSVEALIKANFPVLALFGNRAVNRFGDILTDRTWQGRMGDTGLPVLFRTDPSPQNSSLYQTLVNRGISPPELRRYVIEDRHGDLTEEQWGEFARRSGARLKADTLANLATLRAMPSDEARAWLSKTARAADDEAARGMGLPEPVRAERERKQPSGLIPLPPFPRASTATIPGLAAATGGTATYRTTRRPRSITPRVRVSLPSRRRRGSRRLGPTLRTRRTPRLRVPGIPRARSARRRRRTTVSVTA